MEELMKKKALIFLPMLLMAFCLAVGFSGMAMAEDRIDGPITLKTMGSFMFGGTVTKTPAGETFHGDHGYAQYYLPENSRNYPLIMWHGIGQSGKSFESTPDGREGFQAILPRRDWPVYIIDQPRRGRAGYTKAKSSDPKATDAVPTIMMESSVWDAFRNGIWVPPLAATLFPGVKFPHDPASIEQFFRQQTPDTGEEPLTPEHRAFMGQAMAELLKRTGPAVLITHSNSGQYGWAAGMASPDLVKAIVAYEPGACAFPDGERPEEIPAEHELVNIFQQPQMVPMADFKKLTAMPILVIFGDNIGREPSKIFNVEVWRVAKARARQFVEAVNRHGGKAQLVILPEIGINGNTHAPFADTNNLEIADHLERWLASQGLDGREQPHEGPQPQKTELTIPLQ
jgi:pimeloyl-ACP methyl ester carboxylesterase